MEPGKAQGVQIGKKAAQLQAPLSPEKEHQRAATKARNAEAGAKAATAKEHLKASKLVEVMPGHENALVEPGLMTKYLFNMGHYATDESGQYRPKGSHGHDKAVRFSSLGYNVIEEGETQPSDAVRQSIDLLTRQIKDLASKNPAKLTSDRTMHEKKMEKRVAAGAPTFPFPGNQYSIEGVLSTPNGARALLKTGWKTTQPSGEAGPSVPVLVSAYFK